DDDGAGRRDVARKEVSPGHEVATVELRPARIHGGGLDVLHDLAVHGDLRGEVVADEGGPHLVEGRNGADFFRRHLRVVPPGRSAAAVVHQLDLVVVEARDDEVARSGGLDLLDHAGADAGDHGAHDHDGRHTHDDAADGQHGPELVRP